MERTMRVTTYALLLLSTIMAGLIACGMPFPNEDLFLAFSSGREVLSGNLAAPDSWSFTMSGKVWVDQSWLSHLTYYLAFLKLGYAGPVLIKALLLAGCLVLLYVRCRGLGVSSGSALVALTLGTLAIAPFLKIRAENFGMFYFVLLSGVVALPASWRRWSQIGSVVVLAMWANSHGSFMLGFALVGLRLVVELLDRYEVWDTVAMISQRVESEKEAPDGSGRSNSQAGGPLTNNDTEERRTDPWGWLATVFAAIIAIAFVNPYGLQNLAIPFRQLFAKTLIAEWVDWRPLIHWRTLLTRGWFKPLSVLPFLALLGILGLLAVTLFVEQGLRRTCASILGRPSDSNAVMETLIPLMLAPIVFKFQRMIVFAAPALIPLLAVLIQQWRNLAKTRLPWVTRLSTSRFHWPALAGLACVWLALLGAVFFRSVVVPYLPGNPLHFQRTVAPLVQRLMSNGLMRTGAVQFMKRNEIHGRIFTNVFLSNCLSFSLPDIQLFFDLRAQSFFPDEIIKAYLFMMRPDPEHLARTQELLKQYHVSFVVLDTTASSWTQLANLLMETRQWGCIYSDGSVIILANIHDKRYGPLIAKGSLEGLWYGDSRTRVFSEALLSFFMKGTIEPRLLGQLVEIQQRAPDPNVYGLIVAAMNGKSECLNRSTKAFLESEARRLAASDYLVPGGAFSILRSLLRILVMLERNEILCEQDKAVDKYRVPRRKFTEVLDHIKRRYGGF